MTKGKNKVVLEIQILDGIIDPANEQAFLVAFQRLAVNLQQILLSKEQLNTSVQVTLK